MEGDKYGYQKLINDSFVSLSSKMDQVINRVTSLEKRVKVQEKQTVYRVFDEDFTFYADIDGIIDWIKENLFRDEVITQDQLNEHGWVYALEKAGLSFEIVYER